MSPADERKLRISAVTSTLLPRVHRNARGVYYIWRLGTVKSKYFGGNYSPPDKPELPCPGCGGVKVFGASYCRPCQREHNKAAAERAKQRANQRSSTS